MPGRAELDRDVPTVWRMLSTGRMADKGGKCRHNGKHGGIRRIKTMMEQILEPENLSRAWHRVKTNAGAPGIDGMSIEAFPDFNREHWPRICSALMDGTYRPAPVRRVFIPKPDGSQRPLGVPTVLDRVIQAGVGTGADPSFRERVQRTQLWIPREPQCPSGRAADGILLEVKTPPCGGLRPEIVL